MTEASDTITTLTQERDAMRVVLTSEIDARIKAESRALTADGLRVQLAEAQDRLTLCAAEVERLRTLLDDEIKAQRYAADEYAKASRRAEKAEAERDEARDSLGRTVDQRDEAQADCDAAKTRIAAALRCLAGKHYPAAIQALTIGTAQGCVVPPDPAMLVRKAVIARLTEALKAGPAQIGGGAWDIDSLVRVAEQRIIELDSQADWFKQSREQYKSLADELAKAERAREGWRGRCLESERIRALYAPGWTPVNGPHGRPCPGCAGWVATAEPAKDVIVQAAVGDIEREIEASFWAFDAERKRTGAERDAYKGQMRAMAGWVASNEATKGATPAAAARGPAPDHDPDCECCGGTGRLPPVLGPPGIGPVPCPVCATRQPDPEIPLAALRRDVERLTRQRDEAKQAAQIALGSSDRAAQALRAAQELAEVLRSQRDEAQALVQKVRDFADDEQKRAEFFQVEESKALDRVLTAEMERDVWKARAKEAEDRAGFAQGRNKASADADKAQRERDEARAEVAILRAGDERPADLIIKAAPYAELVRDLAAAANYMAFGPLKARARALTGDATAPAEQPVQEAGRFRVRADRSTGELRLQVETGGSWLNPELRRAGFQHGDVVALVKVGDLAPLGTAPATPDLPRAIHLLVSRPAPTHETIQRLCKWIGGIPLGETHRVLMELCKAGRIINRGLPDGYRLADEAAVHIAPLGTAPGGYDAPAPVAPEQMERIETAPSWERAREAWRAMRAAYGDLPKEKRQTALGAMVYDCDTFISRAERGWHYTEKGTHAIIDALEKAARDASLWWRSIGVLTDFARSILALREATPRHDPIPADVPTGQEDQHDADMRANEATTKETP